MPNRYDFWVHGIDVRISDWSAVQNRHLRGWGTRIVQAQGSSNWFLFAVPTPTVLDGDDATCHGLFLSGQIDSKATIDRVTVHRSGDGQPLGDWQVSLSARDLGEWYDLGNIPCQKALTLCVHVNFDGPGNGEVQFDGVGGRFEEP